MSTEKEKVENALDGTSGKNLMVALRPVVPTIKGLEKLGLLQPQLEKIINHEGANFKEAKANYTKKLKKNKKYIAWEKKPSEERPSEIPYLDVKSMKQIIVKDILKTVVAAAAAAGELDDKESVSSGSSEGSRSHSTGTHSSDDSIRSRQSTTAGRDDEAHTLEGQSSEEATQEDAAMAMSLADVDAVSDETAEDDAADDAEAAKRAAMLQKMQAVDAKQKAKKASLPPPISSAEAEEAKRAAAAREAEDRKLRARKAERRRLEQEQREEKEDARVRREEEQARQLLPEMENVVLPTEISWRYKLRARLQQDEPPHPEPNWETMVSPKYRVNPHDIDMIRGYMRSQEHIAFSINGAFRFTNPIMKPLYKGREGEGIKINYIPPQQAERSSDTREVIPARADFLIKEGAVGHPIFIWPNAAGMKARFSAGLASSGPAAIAATSMVAYSLAAAHPLLGLTLGAAVAAGAAAGAAETSVREAALLKAPPDAVAVLMKYEIPGRGGINRDKIIKNAPIRREEENGARISSGNPESLDQRRAWIVKSMRAAEAIRLGGGNVEFAQDAEMKWPDQLTSTPVGCALGKLHGLEEQMMNKLGHTMPPPDKREIQKEVFGSELQFYAKIPSMPLDFLHEYCQNLKRGAPEEVTQITTAHDLLAREMKNSHIDGHWRDWSSSTPGDTNNYKNCAGSFCKWLKKTNQEELVERINRINEAREGCQQPYDMNFFIDTLEVYMQNEGTYTRNGSAKPAEDQTIYAIIIVPDMEDMGIFSAPPPEPQSAPPFGGDLGLQLKALDLAQMKRRRKRTKKKPRPKRTRRPRSPRRRKKKITKRKPKGKSK